MLHGSQAGPYRCRPNGPNESYHPAATRNGLPEVRRYTYRGKDDTRSPRWECCREDASPYTHPCVTFTLADQPAWVRARVLAARAEARRRWEAAGRPRETGGRWPAERRQPGHRAK